MVATAMANNVQERATSEVVRKQHKILASSGGAFSAREHVLLRRGEIGSDFDADSKVEW